MSVAAMDALRRPLPLIGAATETRPWQDVAFLFGALFVITFGAYAVDERVLDGISVWIKPLKFQASLALHFATLAVLAGLLEEARRRSRTFSLIVGASVAAGLFEIAYIMLQAARGRASHFNNETALESVMYALMGVGAVILVLAPLIIGVWLLRDHGRRLRADPLRLGAALGLVVAAVSTLAVAGYMSTSGGHWVGEVATDVGGLPVFGWSQQVGDLRVAHFFSAHAMQVLPLAGLGLRNAGVRGSLYVIAGSAAYLSFTGAVFAQALLGRPFPGL